MCPPHMLQLYTDVKSLIDEACYRVSRTNMKYCMVSAERSDDDTILTARKELDAANDDIGELRKLLDNFWDDFNSRPDVYDDVHSAKDYDLHEIIVRHLSVC